MLVMIPSWVTNVLAAGCLLCVVLCVWQIVQPDAYFEKRLTDDASFARRHRALISVMTAIGTIAMLALVAFEMLRNK